MSSAESNTVLWFRHGLRLHDNPALQEAIRAENSQTVRLFPIFIFDGETAGTKWVGYNRMRFLLDSLEDLDAQFRSLGGQLLVLEGDPVKIFRRLWEEFGISKICFEQDCEPIWRTRDETVAAMCGERGIECHEFVSHTLWDPEKIIEANGGIPPLTYQMFMHTAQTIGLPPRPIEEQDLSGIQFGRISKELTEELHLFDAVPLPEYFGVFKETDPSLGFLKWTGGEQQALRNLKLRLNVEENAFKQGSYLPNQATPDLLGPSTSLSAHLRFGCLSVRKFYWEIHDLFTKAATSTFPSGAHITGQLIWREYFYTMSVTNPNYDRIEGNPICLNIAWAKGQSQEAALQRWCQGQTGFPIIDAAMRQLLAEGWLHHALRNVTATFLTRGALWISWEDGLKHFFKYLLDADWSVCAGNWMWVSSSAFEKLLDSSICTCPIAFGRRLDPTGEYIRRYVPELRVVPKAFIHAPWKAPIEVQEEAGCLVGIDYPEPMVDLKEAGAKNRTAMKAIREELIAKYADNPPDHCRPSSEDEIRQFFWLSD